MDVIVLAAGASSRMGHPKALTRIPVAPWRDLSRATARDGTETALERIVRACDGFRVLVVVGEHADAIRAALPALDAKWVVNPRPELGRTGSLQRGLTASRGDPVLILPVDHPLVRADTIQRLAEAPGEWVIPVYRGRGGHPLKLGPMGIAAAMSAPANTPLRDVPAMVGLDVTRVEVDDPGILANLDTPADLGLAGQGAGVELR